MNAKAQLAEYRLRVENALNDYGMQQVPGVLRDAMRYSLLSPGKRLRGSLCLAAYEMAGATGGDAVPFAMALEMIHAYSLIHDDLPAMDNDTLRRGLPTNHVVYGEAMAILAGDGLLNEAFQVMSESENPHALKALRCVARYAGSTGMCAGQALDVSLQGTKPDRETVLSIHTGKTAALIRASVGAGMILAGATEEQLCAGDAYGYHLGLAFQIIDDLLDLVGDEKELGKHTGKDAQEGKITWVSTVGLEKARQDAAFHTEKAVLALDRFGEKAEFLQSLAKQMLDRVK